MRRRHDRIMGLRTRTDSVPTAEVVLTSTLLYSLVGSCERAGNNPIAYLTDVLDRVDSTADDGPTRAAPKPLESASKPARPVDFQVK